MDFKDFENQSNSQPEGASYEPPSIVEPTPGAWDAAPKPEQTTTDPFASAASTDPFASSTPAAAPTYAQTPPAQPYGQVPPPPPPQQYYTPVAEPPKKKGMNPWLIALIVILVLCCCCTLIAGIFLWNNGDAIIQEMESYSRILPLFLVG